MGENVPSYVERLSFSPISTVSLRHSDKQKNGRRKKRYFQKFKDVNSRREPDVESRHAGSNKKYSNSILVTSLSPLFPGIKSCQKSRKNFGIGALFSPPTFCLNVSTISIYLLASQFAIQSLILLLVQALESISKAISWPHPL